MENDILSARDWLKKAGEYIAVAEHLLKTSEFYADVCFHCQQAAEKSLKAVLVYYREVPRKIHLLKKLLNDCLKYDDSLKSLVPDLDTDRTTGTEKSVKSPYEGKQKNFTANSVQVIRFVQKGNIPDYPIHPCHNCGCPDYWLTDWNQWLCCRCHPEPQGGEE